jgi:hypothetical protein
MQEDRRHGGGAPPLAAYLLPTLLRSADLPSREEVKKASAVVGWSRLSATPAYAMMCQSAGTEPSGLLLTSVPSSISQIETGPVSLRHRISLL